MMTARLRSLARFKAEEHRMLAKHKATAKHIYDTMTLDGAFKVLRKREKRPAGLLQTVQGLLNLDNKSHRTFLKQPAGYSGVEGARNMLNEMLLEVNNEFDFNMLECSTFFESHCTLMENTRTAISDANSAAAGAREQILAAQAVINHCEVEIPCLCYPLEENVRECYATKANLEVHKS